MDGTRLDKRQDWIFNKIVSTDFRLQQLGIEAKTVMKQIKQTVGPSEVMVKFENIANASTKGIEICKILNGNSLKRCKWWNRGYCRESINCPYSHPQEDCNQYLQGGCSVQGCSYRHRRRCKYWGSTAGCFRGEYCQYLHSEIDHENIENQSEHKTSIK